MKIAFNPAISYRKNSVSQNKNMSTHSAQNVNFTGWDMGVKTVEDFFKKRPNIQTFLSFVTEHTPQNEKLIANIRAEAAKRRAWDITGVIDGNWYKREPFKG